MLDVLCMLFFFWAWWNPPWNWNYYCCGAIFLSACLHCTIKLLVVYV